MTKISLQKCIFLFQKVDAEGGRLRDYIFYISLIVGTHGQTL